MKKFLSSTAPEFSLEFCEDVGMCDLEGVTNLLCSTCLNIKGICLLKAHKFEPLKYTGENTAAPMVSVACPGGCSSMA